jgi:hypothetical protein
MRKLMILAPVLALAVSGANCAGDSSSSGSPTGPSSVVSESTTAGKGGGGGGKGPGGGSGGTSGGSGALQLVMLSDANGDLSPNWGDRITFNLTTTADKPFVGVNCYQGGAWVYAASVGYFDAYPWAKEFTLAASSWPSGAADCTARLYTSTDGSSSTTLATMSFHVGG